MTEDIFKVRRQILDRFLENLSGISDREYQRRVWIEGRGPEVDDFDETVCDFFDLGESIFDNFQGYGITESQYLLLKKFRDEFRAFSKEHDFPEEFIDTPEWARIMDMANEVLAAFDYKKSTLHKAKDDKPYMVQELLQGMSYVTTHKPPKRDWVLAEEQETPAFADHLSDLGDQILERYQEFGISDSQYKLIKQFCDAFKAFCKKHGTPEPFTDTPEWAKIVEMAKEVLKAFQKDS